jgi:hypothetical protein
MFVWKTGRGLYILRPPVAWKCHPFTYPVEVCPRRLQAALVLLSSAVDVSHSFAICRVKKQRTRSSPFRDDAGGKDDAS